MVCAHFTLYPFGPLRLSGKRPLFLTSCQPSRRRPPNLLIVLHAADKPATPFLINFLSFPTTTTTQKRLKPLLQRSKRQTNQLFSSPILFPLASVTTLSLS